MKRRNKTSAPTEEMEFTFLPETAEEQTVTPAEPEAEIPPAEDPQVETDEITESESKPVTEEEKPAEASAPSQKPKEKEKGILGICLPLIIICIGVALMLAAVNALTEDTIAAQAAAEKERAVIAIFPDATTATLYETTEDGEIYLAIRENELIGCCISLVSGGFAGDISMMVGRTAEGEICGVQLISMSESPGIGTKTKSQVFLSQYRGGETFVIGENVDAIAGATVSSRAVTAGVNRALALPLDFPAIADAYSLTLGTAEISTPADTAPAETDTPEAAPTEETENGGEETETESTSSILAMPSVAPAAAVNRVILVSTTLVTEVETQAEETEETPPETEAPTETENTSAPLESEDTSEEETSDTTADTAETEDTAETTDATETEDTAETTGPAETEDTTETTGPAETEDTAETTGPVETEDTAEITGPAETEVPDDTDTTTEPDSVETADTETDSDTAAA